MIHGIPVKGMKPIQPRHEIGLRTDEYEVPWPIWGSPSYRACGSNSCANKNANLTCVKQECNLLLCGLSIYSCALEACLYRLRLDYMVFLVTPWQ